MRQFDEAFGWDILIAGNSCNFDTNMKRLVIKLLNCRTGLMNIYFLTQYPGSGDFVLMSSFLFAFVSICVCVYPNIFVDVHLSRRCSRDGQAIQV